MKGGGPMITTVNELPMRSKEDAVNIRMDITIDLPKEVAGENDRHLRN